MKIGLHMLTHGRARKLPIAIGRTQGFLPPSHDHLAQHTIGYYFSAAIIWMATLTKFHPLRPCLYELFHPGMTFISLLGDLHLGCLVIYLWVLTWFGAKMCSPRDYFIPVLKTRMKSPRGKPIFAPNHVNTQVNDQTPRWKSPQDEIKVIPGWNNPCKQGLS